MTSPDPLEQSWQQFLEDMAAIREAAARAKDKDIVQAVYETEREILEKRQKEQEEHAKAIRISKK